MATTNRRRRTGSTTPGTRGTPRRIGGRYRLGRRIGRGGMATVYRATDEQLDRPVAVKVMRSDLGDDPTFLRRFEAEARRAASVSHPNVVAVYDVGTDDDPYIVMELVRGGDAAALLRRDGALLPERAAELVADAADAVAAAHAAGIVHRDLKPGNILIGSDGRARVADFGIARATGEGSMTRTGAALGSVDYFSPEQARGERAGPASDVYALGVVLYELLTGRRPFVGDTPYAVATARLGAAAPDPRADRPDLPAELATVVRRAMAERPADRYRSAAALRDALRTWLGRDEEPAAVTPAPSQTAAVPVAPPPAPAAVVEAPARPDPVVARQARPVPPTSGRGRSGMLLAALLLVALVGAGAIGMALLGGDDGELALPEVIVGSPGGEAFPNATPTTEPTPIPTMSASLEPTAEPTAEPAAVPTTAALTPQPVAAAPTPAQPAVGEPDAAVAAFYRLVTDGRFDDAYALWSDRMKASFPRQGNLDDRFANTASVRFTELRVASRTADSATVQANFVETYDSGSSRQFIGYWELVRVGDRWLLDWPTY
jgi:eukaryotic-like serine/threonine-protein kinase